MPFASTYRFDNFGSVPSKLSIVLADSKNPNDIKVPHLLMSCDPAKKELCKIIYKQDKQIYLQGM
jgi:hypothetical protein